MVTTATDSFFVYSTAGGTPQLQNKGMIPGLALMQKKNVFYASGGVYSIGGNLYDVNNNLIHSLPAGVSIIGLSADGKYLASSQNEIYETTTFGVVHKFGDGFRGIVYFTSDNNAIIHVTDGDAEHSSRVNRYTWR